MTGTSLGRGMLLGRPSGFLKDGTADNEVTYGICMADLHISPISPWMVDIQEEVREYFSWEESSDIDSINSLIEYSSHPSTPPLWGKSGRQKVLTDIISQLNEDERLVVIIGAAVEHPDLEPLLSNSPILIACDGAVGVLDEVSPESWNLLAMVVSDADGLPYINKAAEMGITISLHAHGDNMDEWASLLNNWKDLPCPPSLFFTHQVHHNIDGAINLGGFTDGDRAVCMLLAFGVHIDRIKLIGFDSTIFGKWSGVSNPKRKREKLLWMKKILDNIGVDGWGGEK
ncbi:MAG TPA: hypothetical protein EYQ53_00165 [Candidatus Poseidoniales archaeon]|nr:hypothetical protein [Candidatus Poseidoniales archaeon]